MFELVIIVTVIACDQASKFLIRHTLTQGETIDIIGGFFSLKYIRNDGAAFSSFGGKQMLLIAVSVMAIIGASFFLRKLKSDGFLIRAALALIIAGGIGNLIDRLMFGYVTDMLSFSIFPPVFNVADIAVVCGCGLLLIYVFFYMDKAKEE